MTRTDSFGNDSFLISLSFLLLYHNLSDVSFCITILFPEVYRSWRKKIFVIQFNVFGFLNTFYFQPAIFRCKDLKKPQITQCPNVGPLRKSFFSRLCMFLMRFS